MENNKYNIAVEVLEERQKEIIKELNYLESTINSLKALNSNVVAVTPEQVIAAPKNSDYNIKGSTGYKIEYILNKNQRFMHFREIAEQIIAIEGTNVSPTELGRELSLKSAKLKREKLIVKFQYDTSARNTFWGVKEWLNKDRSIKRGYEFDPKYLFLKKVRKSNIGLFDNK